MAKTMTKPQTLKKSFVPGSSRGAVSLRSLALQMALEAERQAAIGARIKQRKIELHTTEQDIADRVDVDKRTVQNWIAGKGIGSKNWSKLAAVLEVTDDWLLNGDPPEDESQLDRIESMLGEILRLVRGEALPELAQHFEAALGEPEAPGQARDGTDSESGATSAPRKARSPRTRHSA